MTNCRLLIDEPAPGAWNMAVDEILLNGTTADVGCNLRFYRWAEPTVSLGYFQPHADRLEHPASRHCPLVRRTSGGGAIVHDDELTYSLTVSAWHPLATDTEALYCAVHGSLIDALGQLGVSAALNRQSAGRKTSQEPFLCFRRRSVGDVLVGGVKIAGSAQRRRRGAVLQHGSVLLRSSSAAPQLPGIECLADTPISAGQLIAAWTTRLAARLGLACQTEVITPQEVEQAGQLAGQKYEQSRWTLRR
jgi:lipoate-protein ligase A